MIGEAGVFSDTIKNKNESEDKEKKHQLQKATVYKKKKEKLNQYIETDKKLSRLRYLIEHGKMDKHTLILAKKLEQGEILLPEEVKEIFEKIDEIEKKEDVGMYLPGDVRVTRDEYQNAINDRLFRVHIMTKFNTSLTLLSHKIHYVPGVGIKLFSGFFTLLEKNLLMIHENQLAIHKSLRDLDCEIEQKPLSLWGKLIQFFR